MWPLSLVFLFALNPAQQHGPALDQVRARKFAEIQMKLRRMVLQQNAPVADQDFRNQRLPEIKIKQFALNTPQQDGPPLNRDFRTQTLPEIKMQLRRYMRNAPTWNVTTCFAIRSYVFRADEQAPTLVNTTTCTPAKDSEEPAGVP